MARWRLWWGHDWKHGCAHGRLKPCGGWPAWPRVPCIIACHLATQIRRGQKPAQDDAEQPSMFNFPLGMVHAFPNAEGFGELLHRRSLKMMCEIGTFVYRTFRAEQIASPLFLDDRFQYWAAGMVCPAHAEQGCVQRHPYCAPTWIGNMRCSCVCLASACPQKTRCKSGAEKCHSSVKLTTMWSESFVTKPLPNPKR